MDRPLSSACARLAAFVTELARARLRRHAGFAPSAPLAPLYDSFPELTTPEAFAAATEALAKAREKEDPVAVRRLTLLRAFLAAQVEAELAAPSEDAVRRLEVEEPLPLEDARVPLCEALDQLVHEPLRHRRALLERAIGARLWDARGLYARRLDAGLEAAARLRARGPAPLHEELSGASLAELGQQAERVLARTEDAFRDLLAYALRKLEPTLRPLPAGRARAHDLWAAVEAPWLHPFFAREDLVPAARRSLDELGLAPGGAVRLQLDDAPRTGKDGRPASFAVEPPSEVHLVLQPRTGLGTLTGLLRAWAQALGAIHAPDDAPVELARLRSGEVEEAFALLPAGFPLDPGWLKRYLRLPSATARDAARMAAFAALAELRRRCAQLPYERSLWERGVTEELADEYLERHRRALFVEPHRGFFLRAVAPSFASAELLRGSALSARLQVFLVQRFDEDFWRNPAAGRWLRERLARGGLEDASSLLAALEAPPPSLEERGEQLVDRLNA